MVSSNNRSRAWLVPSVVTFPAWSNHNGCMSLPEPEQVTEHVQRVRYLDCDGEAAVELYVVEGGGHTWPGSPVDLIGGEFGKTTQEISANDLMWDFFVDHPLASALGPGDVNCDGRVNAVDAALVLQFSAGLLGSLPCENGGDVDGDGEVTSIDAALILQFSAGLIGSLTL